MALLWDKICDLFSMLVRPSRRKSRVSFSPSTLHREIIRHTKLTASPNPFFNFLAEMRMKTHGGDFSQPGSSVGNDTVRIVKAAARVWNVMSEDQKQPYRNIALEQRNLKRKHVCRRMPARRCKRKRNSSRSSLQHNSRYNILASVSPELLLSDNEDDDMPNMLSLDDCNGRCGSGDCVFKADQRTRQQHALYAIPRPLAKMI